MTIRELLDRLDREVRRHNEAAQKNQPFDHEAAVRRLQTVKEEITATCRAERRQERQSCRASKKVA